MVVRNFLFHRVSPDTDRLWPPMKPELFARIMTDLKRRYQLVALESFLEDRSAYRNSRKPLATICFDDGYKDNIEYAAPILEKLHCPASFYVVSGCVDEGLPTWTYIVDHCLQQAQGRTLELGLPFLPEQLRPITTEGPDASCRRLKPWMKTLPNRQRLAVMQALQDESAGAPVPSGLMMSWSEVRQLRSAGFVIGSHSRTHPMLGRLEEESEIREELAGSFTRIREELGEAPLAISYPIGSFDGRVIRIAQDCGYRYGLAVEQQFYRTGRDADFAIPRVELYQETWWKTRLRIGGQYSRFNKLWQRIKN